MNRQGFLPETFDQDRSKFVHLDTLCKKFSGGKPPDPTFLKSNSPQYPLGYAPVTSAHVTMNGTQIPQVTSHKHLGVNFNNTLSWQQHFHKVYTSCARRIGMIRRLRRKLHPIVLKRIYLGAVLPKLEYACPVWCGGPTQKLIKMHANFCRRNGTALPSLQTRFDYHTLVMFYKIHTKQAPSYLTSLLPSLSSRSGYTFRKLSYRFPTVSRTSTLSSFLPRAVALWNALPTNVQQASSIYAFKKLLQSHLKI